MKKYFYIALLLFVSANVYSQYSMDGDFVCDHSGENNPALGAQLLHAGVAQSFSGNEVI